MLLTRLAGAPVLIARLFAIGAAMLASWLINRTITFPVAGPPSLREFAQFAAIAWIAAAVNYAIFAAIVFLVPNLNPVFGIAAASLCAMSFSYFGMRYGVFTK